MDAVRAQALHFTYPGQTAPTLRGVDLVVQEGEGVVLAGATGSGKSTLLKALCGIIPHHSRGEHRGEVELLGRRVAVTPLAELCRYVAVVLQNPQDQLVTGSVEQEAAFTLENLATPTEVMQGRVRDALSQVGLWELRRRDPGALSGGQKQRLLLACALAQGARVLLLDEPLSQLDPLGRRQMLELLATLRGAGITVIMAEHHLEEALPYATRLVVLDQGKVLRDGPPDRALMDLPPLEGLGLALPPLARLASGLGLGSRPLTPAGLRSALAQEPRPPAQLREEAARISPPYTSPRPPGEVLVAAEGLQFRYPDGPLALAGVTLQVCAGERLAILGANGAGKSTLLHALAGWIPRAQLGGQITDRGRPRGRRSPGHGLLLQDPDLMLTAPTVLEELALAPRLARVPPREVARRVRRALSGLGLRRLGRQLPLALSRGQRLRVAVASLLTGTPGLLLLDEPTSGQDRVHVEALAAALVGLMEEGELKALVFCTHDLDLARRLATRVVVMAGGRILADGSAAEMLTPPLPGGWGLTPPSWWGLLT